MGANNHLACQTSDLLCPAITHGEEDFIGLTHSVGQSPSEVYNLSARLKNANVTESDCLLPCSEEPITGFCSETV